MTNAQKEFWTKAAALEQKLFDGRLEYMKFRELKQDLKNRYPGGGK